MDYQELKQKYPDAICLCRCGDFYELYGEDAVKAAETLGLSLTRTSRDNANGIKAGDAMCGFPHHALDTYLPRLIRAGIRVAICEPA